MKTGKIAPQKFIELLRLDKFSIELSFESQNGALTIIFSGPFSASYERNRIISSAEMYVLKATRLGPENDSLKCFIVVEF